jgi:predicted small metal-binding protein
LTLNGSDDAELDRLAHEHVEQHHPNDGISDEFIADHIANNARDSVSS